MELSGIREKVPAALFDTLAEGGISKLRPAQSKAVDAGLLDGKSLLVCTPTASGKTLIAELAMMDAVLSGKGKAVYIVPLKALASEKFRDFNERYGKLCKIAMSVGDMDKAEGWLGNNDIVIVTAEKLDSLLRHHAPWVRDVAVVVVDEVHLLNDAGRGPTLEILITMLKKLVSAQFIALSATIGNPDALADWLDAVLVEDDWRPVELKKGIWKEGKVEFY